MAIYTSKFTGDEIDERLDKVEELETYGAGKISKTIECAEVFNDYNNNSAGGVYSHAEGGHTKAKGNYSHTEGYATEARAVCDHAEGIGTIAYGGHQHVQGSYNIVDSGGQFAFIIGNGGNDSTRSNAFAVDWKGNIYVNNSETGVNVSDLNSAIGNAFLLSVPTTILPSSANADDYTTDGQYTTTGLDLTTLTNFAQNSVGFELIVMHTVSANRGVQVMITSQGDVYIRAFNSANSSGAFNNMNWKKLTSEVVV